ncbi:glucuronate isomerase [Enterococcus sp. LJL99]
MFIHRNFLLQTELASYLYHDHAAQLPIIDYHCHLNPEQIAEDYRFTSITELWLGGDHYKWRAMRACGIPERFITGDGNEWEKFLAWAQTVERSLGNPLYHWTHLELKMYFDITECLSEKSAPKIYARCNEFLATHQVTARSLIKNSNVRYVATTDDPLSDLKFHKKIKASGFSCIVAPSFRPDPFFAIGNSTFVEYVKKIELKTNRSIKSFSSLITFLENRIAYFHQCGGRISDHGFTELAYAKASNQELDEILRKALAQSPLTVHEKAQWQGQLMVALGRIYHHHNWVMQIHFGAIRNTNTRLLEQVGYDAGGDSIYDQAQIAKPMNEFLDSLDQTNQLPKTILYNLDPKQNDVIATTVANFQMNNDGIRNKIQFGAAWWFNDSYRGMVQQMDSLADNGLLRNFVGMLTDSRSFLSYSRHHYFRRILANYLAEKVTAGIYPNDLELMESIIKEISYANAETYFDLVEQVSGNKKNRKK